MGEFEEYLDQAVRESQRLYPAEYGALVIELVKRGKLAEQSSATVLVTEHRPFGNQQYVLELRGEEKTAINLPMGRYSVVVFAAGYQPFRTESEVRGREVTIVAARLHEPRRNPPSFAESLGKYGIEHGKIAIRDLDVKEGERRVLSPTSRHFGSDVHLVRLSSVDDAKEVIGISDDFRSMEHPRFGVVASPKYDAGPQRLTARARAAAHEYLYGNSRSVVEWKDILNRWVQANSIDWPVFIFNVVTVGPNGVLELGQAGLNCDVLRVHTTGSVRVTGSGPATIETGTWEQFT